ncbi:MAG: porin [Burkholderiaceae bacterium]
MKNTLTLAAAIAAALGSTIASAQTNVQLYGIADAGVSVVDRGDYTMAGTPAARVSLGNSFQVHSGVQSASRFGIRGTEDLGGGLKAIFAAEAAWNVDDGTGAANGGLNFARRSVVGLGGGFGTILLGRDYTPAFFAGQAADVFGFGLYGTSYAFAQSGGFTTRASNAIHYTSPSWGGLVVRASVGTSERYESPKSQGNLYGASVVYTGGPITASAYYQQVRVATVPASGDTASQKQFGVGAGYNFGIGRVLAGWGRSENPGDDSNFDAWNIGLGFRIGAGELLAGFTRLTADAGRNASLGGTAGVEGKAKILALAYTYPLSKRTNLYATLAQTDNDDGAGFGLYSNATSITAGAPGQKVRAVGLGIRHSF